MRLSALSKQCQDLQCPNSLLMLVKHPSCKASVLNYYYHNAVNLWIRQEEVMRPDLTHCHYFFLSPDFVSSEQTEVFHLQLYHLVQSQYVQAVENGQKHQMVQNVFCCFLLAYYVCSLIFWCGLLQESLKQTSEHMDL